MENNREKVKCPYCGANQAVQKTPAAECHGIWVKCKNQKCKKEFEILIRK